MNFEHTEDRRMLADTLNRFVAEQYGIRNPQPHCLRRQGMDRPCGFAELGAIGARCSPEADGGFGGAGFDVAVVFLKPWAVAWWWSLSWARWWWAGRWAWPAARAKEHIASIIDGSTVVALAHEEPGRTTS